MDTKQTNLERFDQVRREAQRQGKGVHSYGEDAWDVIRGLVALVDRRAGQSICELFECLVDPDPASAGEEAARMDDLRRTASKLHQTLEIVTRMMTAQLAEDAEKLVRDLSE